MTKRRPGLLRPLLRVGAAAALGVAVGRERLAGPDAQARALIHNRRSETLDRVLPAVTDLGSTYAVGGASATLWLLGKKTLARDVLAAGGIAWTLAQATKPLFRRARPYDAGEVEIMVRKPAGLSYPSGHPAVAEAVWRVVEPRVRAPARGLLARVPRVVAFSRVYVGVHYPVDVIGGLLLGRAVGDLWLRYAPNGNGR
jgi:undecaprenyl-diphosphatase